MSQPPPVSAVRSKATEAMSLLHAVFDAYRKAYPALWEPLRAGGLDGAGSQSGGGWSDPTLAAASNQGLAEQRQHAQEAWEHLCAAFDSLVDADDAIGRIVRSANRYREDTRASAWDRPVTADTPADQVPRDLEAAHAALRHREGRP